MFKRVLFPIDPSQESHQALEVVVNVTQTYRSRLILLSVVEESESVSSQGIKNSAEKLAEFLSWAQEMFAERGIEAEIIEREGKPAFVICDVADESDADIIIMGCRGIGLTEEGLAESVTSRVINLSPCPVLIVP